MLGRLLDRGQGGRPLQDPRDIRPRRHQPHPDRIGPNKPGDYAIFLDFDGSEKEERVSRAIAEAEGVARDFRLLGCYVERKI